MDHTTRWFPPNADGPCGHYTARSAWVEIVWFECQRTASQGSVTPEEIQREAMIHGDHPCRACGSWNCRIEWS